MEDAERERLARLSHPQQRRTSPGIQRNLRRANTPAIDGSRKTATDVDGQYAAATCGATTPDRTAQSRGGYPGRRVYGRGRSEVPFCPHYGGHCRLLMDDGQASPAGSKLARYHCSHTFPTAHCWHTDSPSTSPFRNDVCSPTLLRAPYDLPGTVEFPPGAIPIDDHTVIGVSFGSTQRIRSPRNAETPRTLHGTAAGPSAGCAGDRK